MEQDTYTIPEEELERARTREETDKKCPQCGGTVDFDPGSGGLACPFCGYVGEIVADGTAAELDFASAESTGNVNWGVEKKTVLCKSCGAESIYDALEISNECPYCGSNQVMEEKGRDTLAPGGVCVFKLDSKKAGENFHTWLKKKWFTPRKAKKMARPESFKGVYLPYWTFDTQTYSTYTARYGIDRTSEDSDGKSTTETSWYDTSGEYDVFIDDQLMLASTRHEESLMRRIEPFNTADNLAYKPEYVAGFISERYSVGLQEGWDKARKKIDDRIRSGISSKIRMEKGADRVENIRAHTRYEDITYKYLLLPIWLSSFGYKSKVYQFMVNGQTGKVGGKAPVSPLRVILFCAAIVAIIMLLVEWFG